MRLVACAGAMPISLESQQPFILTCLSFLSVHQLGAAAGPSSRLGVLPAALCGDHLACSSNQAARLVSTAAVRFQGRQADFTPTGHWTCRAETVFGERLF